MTSAPSVFRFLDYREFLKAHYDHFRVNGALSHRALSRRAGFRSPNFLKLVMDGERRLSPRSVNGVARACRLDERGSRYLTLLVELQRARSAKERSSVLTRLLAFQERIELFPLERQAASYFQHWWLPVIRELSGLPGFKPAAAWVCRALYDRISVQQAERALDTLAQLGLMADAEDVPAAVTSGNELPTLFMKRYHQELLAVAADSIERTPSELRDISAVTIRGDEATLREAKRMVQRFRKELVQLEKHARSQDHVLQFCLQLFPVASSRPLLGESES